MTCLNQAVQLTIDLFVKLLLGICSHVFLDILWHISEIYLLYCLIPLKLLPRFLSPQVCEFSSWARSCLCQYECIERHVCRSSIKEAGGYVWKRDLNERLFATEIITDKLWRTLSLSWSQICWMKEDVRDAVVTCFQREAPLLNKNCAVSLKWSGQCPRFELSQGMYCWHSLWPV